MASGVRIPRLSARLLLEQPALVQNARQHEIPQIVESCVNGTPDLSFKPAREPVVSQASAKMPGEKYSALFQIAADNFGYIRVEQAREVDVSPKTLHMMAKRGTLEHVSTGLYRVVALPPSAHSEYMEASLWPRGVQGVVSHDSALVLHEMSDVNPAKIHITLPRGYRITRPVPSVYVIHNADLGSHDIERVNGIPVTTPARTIVDCCRAHLGPALIRQAIDDGVRKGLLDVSHAEKLQTECLRST